jgi:fructose-1,6-bisphosphatase
MTNRQVKIENTKHQTIKLINKYSKLRIHREKTEKLETNYIKYVENMLQKELKFLQKKGDLFLFYEPLRIHDRILIMRLSLVSRS